MTAPEAEASAVPHVPAAGEAGPVIKDYRALFLDGTPLLDVRAPVEFARGAFPGAVNVPLLTDEERHEIGIRYKQSGQDAAIARGAELIDEAERARRTARWKAFADAHPDGALYCFRGGLRSRITQHWLSEAGVELPLVAGGYKALRSWLMATLAELCERVEFRLVGGRTGVGKTTLLRRLGRHVDLEGIARHRGSSFGALVEAQPSNIDVENRLTVELLRLDADDPAGRPVGGAVGRSVWLEDEARLIGRVCLPDVLVEAMRRAPIEILEASLEQRVANCMEDYVHDLLARYRDGLGEAAGFDAYAAHHRGSLDRVRKRLGGDNYRLAAEQLESALYAHRERDDTRGYVPFIELMLERYYDPMYDYQLAGKRERVHFSGSADAILARRREHA